MMQFKFIAFALQRAENMFFLRQNESVIKLIKL